MILIGTDDGIYRWFDGCGWPIFHSLQGRVIVSLASPGAGLIAAIDREGTVLESVNNGMDWQVIPGPRAPGTPTPATLAVWGEPETIVLATKPLGLFRRIIGAPLPGRRQRRRPAWAGRARTLAEGATALLAPRRRAATRPIPVWTALGTPEVARGQGCLRGARPRLCRRGRNPVPLVRRHPRRGALAEPQRGDNVGAMPRPARRGGRRPDRPHQTGNRHRGNRRGLPRQHR